MASACYCPRCLTTFVEDPATCPNLGCGEPRPETGWEPVLAPGDLLDRHYRIERALAVGGAGLTYLARAVDAAGEVQPPDLAIKVLYAARDSGPFLKRLALEAQILQELSHDHIVACRGFVHRVGHPPYLVTRFEEGGSLGSHVERVGPLPPSVAAGILDQVLSALDVAHQREIVHRDLKPDNVLLARRVLASEVPWVRVADFGIAKSFGGVGSRVTRLGAFIGTPEYAAPEQFEGLAPRPSTDVWAAGGLLHFLLTGRAPFALPHRGDLESAHAHLVAHAPPRLPDGLGGPEAHARLQAVITHAMALEPGDRWTVAQIREHLAPLRPAQGPTRMPEAPAPAPLPAAPPEEARPMPRPRTAERPIPPPPPPPEPPSQAGAALGMVGLGAVVGVGGALSVVALGIAAWALGWLGGVTPAIGAPVALAPIAVEASGASSTAASGDERRALETALGVAAADLAIVCAPRRAVPLRVVVGADGRVESAAADPRVLAAEPAAGCVERGVSALVLPRSSPGAVHLEVTLPFGG